jgi:hypothetical protein
MDWSQVCADGERTSGWYCTPQIGNDLCLRPCIVRFPSSRGADQAVTTRSSGRATISTKQLVNSQSGSTVKLLYTTTSKSWPCVASCHTGDAKRPGSLETGETGTTCPCVIFGVLMICKLAMTRCHTLPLRQKRPRWPDVPSRLQVLAENQIEGDRARIQCPIRQSQTLTRTNRCLVWSAGSRG